MNEITISKCVKKSRSYIIAVQPSSQEYKLHPEISFKFNIYKGAVFTEEKWRQILAENNFKLAMECVSRLLSRRIHSQREVEKKLYQRKFSSDIVNKVITECQRLQLIDDLSYAKAYVEELKFKNYGPLRIRNSLYQKGLDKNIIDTLMSDINDCEDETARAQTALNYKLKLLKTEKDIRKRKEKLFRFLQGRGFSSDIIFKLIDKIQ